MDLDTLRAIIESKRELDGLPVVANASFGHTTPQFTFPIGGYGKITCRQRRRGATHRRALGRSFLGGSRTAPTGGFRAFGAADASTYPRFRLRALCWVFVPSRRRSRLPGPVAS